MELTWQTKTFKELSTREIFEVLKLRQAVFVVEQECAYPDIDDTDIESMHLCGYNNSLQLIAYARLIKPGVSYDQASIGRVVVSPTARGLRLGESLMHKALTEMERLFPREKFYNDLGFKTVSDMYLEDDIPHIHMLLEQE